MTFSEQLRAERKRLGLSQSDCAALIATSFRVYWDWENGKTEPSEITQEGALARLKSNTASDLPINLDSIKS